MPRQAAATGSSGESRPSRSGAAALLARPALGQGRYPKQAIRLITPWPPGGSRVALLGRRIDMVADAQAWRPQVEKGDVRLLAVWRRTRLPSFPETPTLNDLGYGMTVTSPYGFAGPKGLPPEIVETLHASFRKAMLDEASQAIMRRWELPDEYLGPRDDLAFARERVEYERAMVARLGLTID